MRAISILLMCVMISGGVLGASMTYADVDELTLLAESKLVVGQRALIYVDLASADGNVTMTAKFYPQIDSFSSMTIAGSLHLAYNTFVNEDARVMITILYNNSWVNSTRSTAPIRFTAASGDTVPYYAAWIGVQDGIVEGIAWDTNCDGAVVGGLAADQCSSTRCLDKFCVETCSTPPGNVTSASHPCDIKIYLAWKGIDSNARAMESGGSLPNNFNIFSSKPVFEDVSGTTQDFIYGLLNGRSAGSSVAPRFIIITCLLFLSAVLL